MCRLSVYINFDKYEFILSFLKKIEKISNKGMIRDVDVINICLDELNRINDENKRSNGELSGILSECSQK